MKAASDATLQDAVDYHLRQLRAGDYESALHGLTELDPAIILALVGTYRVETSPDIRDSLLRIVSEFRTPAALPLLAEALRDRRDSHWRTALDGLVTLASSEAIQTLESVLRDEAVAPNPDYSYIEWVREALEQTREAHDTKSNATGNASMRCSAATLPLLQAHRFPFQKTLRSRGGQP